MGPYIGGLLAPDAVEGVGLATTPKAEHDGFNLVGHQETSIVLMQCESALVATGKEGSRGSS